MPVVLIAEDDEDIAVILTRLLSRAGLTVLHAPDGEAAFGMALEKRPDVLLTDLGMPRMDGLELTAAVRAHPDLADTPVVMLSGHLTPGDTRPLIAGACAVLLKPCPNDRLRSVVRGLVERGPHRHDATEPAGHALLAVGR